MALKIFQSLTTPVGTNEQSGVGQAALSASTTFVARGIGSRADRALFLLNVSAVSGTPSLVIKIQGQDPGSLAWVDIATFAAQTAVSAAPLTQAVNPLFFQNVRCVATITGSGTITFSCGGLFISDEIAFS